MTKDDIRLLYEYDRWANHRIIIAAGTLSAEQFTRDLGGSFRSLRNTLLHILGGKWIWLKYWEDPPLSPACLSDLIARRDALFHPDAFPNASVVQSKWMEIEKGQAEFVNRVTNEALERMLPVRGTHIKLMHLMQHVANHSTYHRGQVALTMRQLGAKPPATDFHVFLTETFHEARTTQ
jgi:uncharacterized damage-inducible protein DinB